MSATGLAVVSLITTPGEVAARSAAPPGSVITAPVRWEVLRHALTTQGVVRSARTVTVTASAPFQTVTITKMPVKLGEKVRPGRVITEIDGRPVILLRGPLPAYRNLHQGDHGPDVSELQANLKRLGYADFDPAGDFGPSTSLALLLFYDHLGYRAPMFHPRRVVGSGRLGTAARRRGAAASAIPSAALPMSEVIYIPARSALVVGIGAKVGSVVGHTPVLRLATGAPFVTGLLSPHQASIVRSGMPAQVVSANPPMTATGQVIRVGSHASVGAPPGGYRVRVRTRRALPERLVGAPVRLTILAPVTSGPVLAVPVTAVFAAHGGKSAYVIEVDGSHRHRVPIIAGASANGTVAVQPAKPGQLRRGDRVLVGRHGP